MVQIEHRQRHAMKLKGRRVAEDQHLDDQRRKQHKASTRVAQDLEKLLDQHLAQTVRHIFLRYCKVLRTERIARLLISTAKSASASNGRQSLTRPEPLRKILLSS